MCVCFRPFPCSYLPCTHHKEHENLVDSLLMLLERGGNEEWRVRWGVNSTPAETMLSTPPSVCFPPTASAHIHHPWQAWARLTPGSGSNSSPAFPLRGVPLRTHVGDLC